MKKLLVCSISFLMSFQMSFCQRAPLNGSGKVVNKTFAFNQFTSVDLIDFVGKATIDIGKPYAITIAIDDNLAELLTVTENSQQLSITLKGNTNNKRYLEKTNIDIRISAPTLSAVLNKGNSNIQINNTIGNNCTISNIGNGNTFITGKVNDLLIICNGNGNVDANKLMANNIAIKRNGNGNVYTHSKNITVIEDNGNGQIISKTTASNTPTTTVVTPNGSDGLVNIYLKNNSLLPKKPTIITYEPGNTGNGTNGFFLMPGQRKKLRLLVGAKVYIANNNQVATVMSGNRIDNEPPFLIVKKEDNNRVFGL
ncbi:GIN domain-containing protein [Ferruginibacter yonginensis]|uniref:GIN domain-containing protein n=1 Tax=Ferruginibacter yonginensis TaxID=1310416 RepID=A0ABV8QTG9_9BACT